MLRVCLPSFLMSEKSLVLSFFQKDRSYMLCEGVKCDKIRGNRRGEGENVMPENPNDIRTRITPVLKNYGVRNAVLFGSYAKGEADANSDIDLLVDSGLKGLSFVGLIEDLREALDDRSVDVMDITHIEKDSRVDREIRETGVLIYEE